VTADERPITTKKNGAANPQRRFVFPVVIVMSFSCRAWRLGG